MDSTGLIEKEPIFIDTANNDYRLKDNSPGKKAGDDGYDMGAYLGGPTAINNEETEKSHLLTNRSHLSFRNPFFGAGTIGFKIFTEQAYEHVNVRIHTSSGKHIRTLVSEIKAKGLYFTYWDRLDKSGVPVNAGVFYCVLQVGKSLVTKTMILVK